MKWRLINGASKQDGGFALIEILAALAVLGIIIIPILGLFTAAYKSSQRSIWETIALTVAGDIMDRIKSGDINRANAEKEIAEYKDRYKVEVYVHCNDMPRDGALNMINVYVAPRLGMEPLKDGIMLSSYAVGIIIEDIGTTQSYETGP